jgi:hypothetical protein
MRFIGDAHGKIDRYLALIQGVESSCQLGDMGMGFGIELPIMPKENGFIRGNHDDPSECRNHPNWFSDGLFDSEWNVFFVGGAWSIDWEWRQQYEMSTGRKIWWKDEECSVSQFNEIIDWYEECKPAIMATHDCPSIMAKHLLSHHSLDNSRTRLALDAMWEIHKPEFWVFGHHHKDMFRDIRGTRFICLDELSFIDIKI